MKPTSTTRIDVLAVPTRDRPEGLAALLESFRERLGAGRAPRVLVVDDGATPASRTWLEGWARRHRAPVWLLGARERQAFAGRLVASGCDPEVVRFGLTDAEGLGYAPGALRNAILLETAGEPVLMLDDDMRATPSPAPDRADGAEARAGDPTDVRFFADREAALASVRPGESDVLTLHESMLGCSVRGLDPDHGPVDPWAARKLGDPSARVLATWMGFVGDIASSSPAYYMLQEGPARAELLSSETRFRAALASRQVLRTTRRPTVGEGTFWTPGATAYDGRRLVPPYLPVARGEGLVFGALVRASSSGVLGYLPWVLPHVPGEPRAFGPDDLANLGTSFPLAHLLFRRIAPLQTPSDRDDGERLRGVGRQLEQLSRLPDDDLAELLRGEQLAESQALEARFEALLRSHGRAPAFWARLVERAIEVGRAARGDALFGVPSELRAGDAASSLARTRRMLRRFGALCVGWPDLWEAARELRQRGVTGAQRLAA